MIDQVEIEVMIQKMKDHISKHENDHEILLKQIEERLIILENKA